jgi:predicted site-specific integrase-resolvase
MEKYYAVGETAKKIGVTTQTLRDWDRTGKLKPHHIAKSGYRYYSQEQINQVIGKRNDTIEKRIIGYCRVSSSKQKDALERQIENVKTYLISQGKPFEIISDIGSGINYNKKGLQELIQLIITNQVSKIVVLYKDRLLCFGYELIEHIASLYGCSIEIIDKTEKTEQQELVEDLVQIITVFSCRLQGKRAKKTRELIKDLTDETSSDKGNAITE